MSQRQVRVSLLVLRHLSEIMHKKWPEASVRISLIEADVAPDLRNARIYYSVLGDRSDIAAAGKFLMNNRRLMRSLLGQKIVLKYSPELRFIYDPTPDRSHRLMQLFDEIEGEGQDEQV